MFDAPQQGLTATELQWSGINLDLKEDGAWRSRNLEQFKDSFDPFRFRRRFFFFFWARGSQPQG